MRKWIWVLSGMLMSSSAALAQALPPPAQEPVCDPIGRTSKGDLVYSILCRNIPGLPAGHNGYNPVPKDSPAPAPAPKAPESK